MRLPSDHLNRVGLRATAAVVVRHSDGEFEAHFDDRTQDVTVDPADIESTAPMLSACRTIDVANIIKDTPIEIATGPHAGESYRFVKHEPDGTGMSRVILRL